MLRKIFIPVFATAFLIGLLACQSDEGVTGPVNLNEDDPPTAGVWGFVRYPDGVGAYPCYVEAYDVDVGVHVDSTHTGPKGWYQMTDPKEWLKQHEHVIRLSANDYYNYTEVYFTYDANNAPAWICLELPFPP